MDGRPTWTDCDEAGDYVVPNVLSPRDLVFRLDNMDETVPHNKTFHHENMSVYCLPLTPHFNIGKLGFTGVYIIFLFLL